MIQHKPIGKNTFPVQEMAAKVFPVLKEERTQSVVIIGLTFIALSVFGFFAISPTINTIVNLKKQLDDNRLIDQQLQDKITNLSVLQQKYTSLQPELALALAAIPESHKIPLFLGQIQAIAEKNNIILSKEQIDPLNISITSATDITSFSFSLTAQGSQENIRNFIATLASFERIVTFNTITMTTSTNESQKVTQVDINGKAYFKPL